ncbi:MAG TPA: LysR family transcriptional regulator [Anaerolineales bacterium]|nr:LysR family transcriptional regulator [Anaerolineales bacterium]
MKARYNVWLEAAGGGIILSPWRARLLEAVGRIGSITGAADELKVPYRRAWEKLKEMEANYGQVLVNTEIGGPHGGGATLTESARDLMQRFRVFEGGLEEEIEGRYRRAFGG